MKKAQSKLDGVISAERLAVRWGMSPRTLENWRSAGKGPDFIRVGGDKGSLIVYRVEDVMEYESIWLVKTRKP